MEKQMVVFELGNEFYGVDIAAVEGIIKMQAITKMPQAPVFVEGITNLRGSVVPVIDLRTRFGLPRQEASKETRIITIVMDGTKIGMVVDGVSEVLSVPDDSIEPPPPMVTTVNSAFIKGIAKMTDRLVIILDLGKVLTTEERAFLTSNVAA
ncbi:MAG: chemotaxis protein CheW [Anaerolineaceae bacterium]